MIKLLPLFFLCFLSQAMVAQDSTITAADKAILDSMLKQDVFFKMLTEAQKPSSFATLSVTAGNSYFSAYNRRINSSQLESYLVITPSAGYFHKSGLGLSVAAFHVNNKTQPGFYQFSISPSFQWAGSDDFSATVNYTRFFRRNGYEALATPLQHELFGSIFLKKPWIQPGIALSYSKGSSTTYQKIDTVLNNIRRMFTDTLYSKSSNFAFSAFIQHSIEFYQVLHKNDALSFLPQLSLNAGSNSYAETHENPFFTKLKSRPRFKNVGSLQQNSSFGIQSVSFSLDINYIIGKFALRPQAFVDYYLPSSTDQKFSGMYSVEISYTF